MASLLSNDTSDLFASEISASNATSESMSARVTLSADSTSKRPAEDREPAKEPQFRVVQQCDAPVQGRRERAVPRQNGPTARGVKPHVVVQPERKIADRLDAQACRHQFDGQRMPSTCRAICGEQPAVGILERAGTHGLRTLDQQFDRRRRHGFGQVGTLQRRAARAATAARRVLPRCESPPGWLRGCASRAGRRAVR